MLSQRDYNRFNLAMSKIIRDCYMPEPNKDELDCIYHGRSSHTKENTYYYNKKARNHADALIEICKFLPKMENVAIGTAGTIVFSDLLTDTKIPGLLKKQLVTADHFINLALHNNVIAPEKIELKNGDFVTYVNLRLALKDKFK